MADIAYIVTLSRSQSRSVYEVQPHLYVNRNCSMPFSASLVYHLTARDHITNQSPLVAGSRTDTVQNGCSDIQGCMEAHHATSVRWSMSPTCLVDQHSALPDRTVCGFCHSNCQPSAVERFRSQQHSFGTVCPTSRQPIRCRLSGSN